GSYPAFTISSTSTAYAHVQGIDITPGNEIVNIPPDKAVTITGGGNTTVSGAYPDFTISSTSTIYTPGQGIEITPGNAINNLGDLSDTNEIQHLSLVNSVISLSKGGGSVNLPTAGPGISIVNNMITNTQPDQPITLDGGGNTTVTGTYPNFTITSTGDGGVAPGTGIEMDVNGSTTIVSAQNTVDMWNAAALRGRPIDGMPPNPGQVMMFKNTSSWASVDNDFNFDTTNNRLEVAALRGRPIDGMAPNPGFMMMYQNDAKGWRFLPNDLKMDTTATGDTIIQVAALRGRPIDGMAPNPGYMMMYQDDANGWKFLPNDLALDTDDNGNPTIEVAALRGFPINVSSIGQDRVLMCKSNGSGLEFRCEDPSGFTVPYSYTENTSNSTLFSMTTNTTNTNYVMQITNNGTGANRNGIRGVTMGTNSLMNPGSPTSPITSKNFYYPGGIFGENTHTSPYQGGVEGAAVVGRAVAGGNDRGVGGWFQGNGFGVLGACYNEGTAAVMGYSQRGYKGGMFFINPPTNWYSGTGKSNYTAVYGRTFDTYLAYAGYFVGDVYISGGLEVAGSKNFKIDHPQDPANKYLYHSCVESPDMKNIYDGVVTTNAEGFATVELPAYFEALNKDFRYQLTCIGDFAQAIVAKKIENNRFVIRTDKPNMEVSWQVTGIRKDPWAEAHPMKPEVEKDPNERGKYLHPELYGKPETKEVGYRKEER
ncbi:MAG TPA: hypothetical protein PK228_18875, partial [Saprospiraceae bacterium]|nr:hypothetical protein [Saprospiraceae bacterium]